jgi:hypothetical protein
LLIEAPVIDVRGAQPRRRRDGVEPKPQLQRGGRLCGRRLEIGCISSR